MGHIFIGLVRCGARGCFDEFNCLEEAVLSRQYRFRPSKPPSEPVCPPKTARQGGKLEVMRVSCDRHGTVQSLLVLIKPVRYNNASSIIAIGKAHSRYDNRFS